MPSPWSAAGVAALALSGVAAAQVPPNSPVFSDDFEAYAPGVFPCGTTGCTGAGGWGVWFYEYGPGPHPGQLVSGVGHSGTHAVWMSPRTDIVRRCNFISGVWRVTSWTWFPPEANASTDSADFILFNESDGVAPEGFASIILFEGQSGTVKNTWNPSQNLPLVRGRWAELRLELNVDLNRLSVWYDGQPLFVNETYRTEGPLALQCINWYSDGVDGMLFDDVSIQPIPGTCYPNCDNSTIPPVLNVQDFNCFMGRFNAGSSWANCDASTAPPLLNVLDFNCFLNRYLAGCP
jgi:hypothetical protein